MLKRLMVTVLACAAVTGCVTNYADRDVAQGAAPASLIVVNAPAGATIQVDGRPYGTVGAEGAPLTPGRHEVVVEFGGRRIHTQSIFVAAGARAEVRIP
ncbi:MAG: hypothetical protein B7Z42_13530 [Brevundimonas sp. 12-68-7]|uniref:PEGA domain-containing protein n=1 Tax=Brevundimonas subvibrioides TaxID=74313 RepID=A0A258FUK0_9CAUL|nr:MAG: hypothetical protein B7Z42_13530 [Brevundimonas sp. 12-68-7]OYX36171.1 MAG: hypothetical protein B7Z01_00530 [Brevundimonas subvibrioides]